MKIDLCCVTCVHERKALDGLDKVQVEAELTDDGLFKATCKNGHEIIAVLQNPKYELLFDLAGLALLDGYTRESVSSFAVSLERFYEFIIKVAFIHKRVDLTLFDSYWKKVSNQSERQIGCFLTTYIDLFHEIPPMLTDKETGFRNNVVHKGYIASEHEVYNYGNRIGTLIQEISKKMIALNEEAFTTEVFRRFQITREKNKVKNSQISTMCIPTMLSTIDAEFGKKDFNIEEEIDQLKIYRTYVYSDFRKKHVEDCNYRLLKKVFGNFI